MSMPVAEWGNLAQWDISSGLFNDSSSGPKGVITGYVAFLAELWISYPERSHTLITFSFLLKLSKITAKKDIVQLQDP